MEVERAISLALFLVEKALSLLDQKVGFQKKVHDDIKEIRDWLETIQAHLRDNESTEGSEVQKDRVNKLRKVAYDIEVVLDEYMFHVPQHFHRHRVSKMAHAAVHFFEDRHALEDMSSKIKTIKTRITNIFSLLALDPHRIGKPSGEGSSSGTRWEDHATHQMLEEDEIVGFEEHRRQLIGLVVRGEARRMSIWVAGLGGSGKTVLVKKVYESKEVMGQFDCHAWIRVSRSFNIDQLLWSMYEQFCVGREKLNSPQLPDIREKLRNHLQQKRYVVVLDDIWRKQDWELIVNALPKNIGSNGSRIIVTTQNFIAVDSPHEVLNLTGLSPEHARDLLCKKAFQASRGICPPQLVEWANKIVKKCDNLPLAILAVGSLLSNKQPSPEEWRKVHDSLGSEIIRTDSSLSRVLLPSYKDLSSNLKSCFLYFSIFPEDYSIKRRMLIRLWVAEGFVKQTRGKTVEEVAEEYLNELIGRKLVQASSRDFDGRVSSCQVQNLLVREFIFQKSEEENFATIFTDPDTNLSDNFRCLSIRDAYNNLSRIRGLSCVRTSFTFGCDNFSLFQIEKVLHCFRLLRVLDLQGAALDKFPEVIVKLTLLRYLSLRQTNIQKIPATIKKLTYLETLDLKHTLVTKLPSEIHELQYLRHLLVYRYDVKNYVTYNSVQGVEVSAGIGALSSIQKLSLVKVNRHLIKELGNLRQLRKLGLIDLKREDGKALCASVQKMPNLSTLDIRSKGKEYLDLDDMGSRPLLQRLYLKGRLQKLPGWFSSLDSVVSIGLKWSGLKDNDSPLEALQALPNLIKLEMVDCYTGEELVFKAGTFKKLKILHIEQFDRLNMVKVEVQAMPNLEKLTLCKCKNLKIPPFDISNHTHLEELLLYDMHKDFIAKLQKRSGERWMVDQIRLIHSFTLESSSQFPWSFQNLS